jgi:hypothetical protein
MKWMVANSFPDLFREAISLDGHNGFSAGFKQLNVKWCKQ